MYPHPGRQARCLPGPCFPKLHISEGHLPTWIESGKPACHAPKQGRKAPVKAQQKARVASFCPASAFAIHRNALSHHSFPPPFAILASRERWRRLAGRHGVLCHAARCDCCSWPSICATTSDRSTIYSSDRNPRWQGEGTTRDRAAPANEIHEGARAWRSAWQSVDPSEFEACLTRSTKLTTFIVAQRAVGEA